VSAAGQRCRRAGALALLALLGCGTGLPPAPAPTNPTRYLSINDVYVADTLDDGSGGLARVATARQRIAAEGPTLLVLAGDFLSPSLLSKYYHGRQMVDALNAAKLDYATFGNHEFELNRDTLVARIAESNFKWLSSNCGEAGGQPFPKVLAWDTLRLAGKKIGMFGLTLQGDYPGYVRCTDPDSAARRMLDTLSAQGAEFIVAVTHQSLEADRALLNRELKLDLILGGHEHEAHTELIAGRHVLKADANARSMQFATVWGAKGQWRQAVALLPMHATIPVDTAVERVVRAWQDSLQRRLGPERHVGELTVPLDARDARQREQESPLGDLVTDAMRTGTGADIALLNAGTIRLDDVLRPGPLTNRDLESMFLFADDTRIVKAPLTGARLRELLERSVSDGVIGKGGFLQVSGLSFTYDPTQPSGSRLTGALRRTSGKSGTIGLADRLTVALSGYIACDSGDGYQVPEAQAACGARQQAPRAVDLVAAYLTDSLAGRIGTPPAGRIVRR
jgi:5'-nucleotidase